MFVGAGGRKRRAEHLVLLRRHEHRDLAHLGGDRCVSRQDAREQLLYFCMLYRAVFPDEQLLEQPLVEESALGRQCAAVLLPAEPSDFERAFQLFIELFEGLLCNGDLSSGRIDFSGRAINPLLQQVQCHGPGVVARDQRVRRRWSGKLAG